MEVGHGHYHLIITDNIQLPPRISNPVGDDLILTVAGNNSNTIVIVHSVGPLIVEPWIDHPNVTAVIWAGLPGQESGMHSRRVCTLTVDSCFLRDNPLLSKEMQFAMSYMATGTRRASSPIQSLGTPPIIAVPSSLTPIQFVGCMFPECPIFSDRSPDAPICSY